MLEWNESKGDGLRGKMDSFVLNMLFVSLAYYYVHVPFWLKSTEEDSVL